MGDEEKVPARAVRAQIERIRRSPHFAESGRLSVLLAHLVEEALAGNTAALKEAAIGNAVYARDPAYDPRFDSTVRVEARRLRKKLKAYYGAPGTDDRVEIALATGTYVPTFSWLSEARRASHPAQPGDGTFRPGTGAILAVLPFTTLSRDADDERFADELTDEIIYAMEQGEGFRVTSRRVAFQHRAREVSTITVARETGADAVLQGTIRRVGEALRVTVELSDPAGLGLWSDRFEAVAHTPHALQEEIAATILSRIRLDNSRMRSGELGPTPAALKANAAIYRARQFLDRQSPRDLRQALDIFSKVAASAPDYARGFSGIADCQCDLFRLGLVGRQAALEAARPAALKAIEIDPMSVEGHTALATVQAWLEWDREAAEASFRKALGLGDNARCARLYAVLLTYVGREQEAEALFTRARRMEPISLQQDSAEALCDFQRRRFARLFGQVPGTRGAEAAFYCGLAQALNGARHEALAGAERLDAMEVDFPLLAFASAEIRAWAGEKDDAARILRGGIRGGSAFARATLAMSVGASQDALAWLDEALSARELNAVWIARDPRFEALHGDARFEALLLRLREPAGP